MAYHIIGNCIFEIISKYRKRAQKQYPGQLVRDIDISTVKDILETVMMYEWIQNQVAGFYMCLGVPK